MKSILQSSNGVRVSDWNNLEYCRLLHCPKLSKSEVHHRYSWLQKCIYILCVCLGGGTCTSRHSGLNLLLHFGKMTKETGTYNPFTAKGELDLQSLSEIFHTVRTAHGTKWHTCCKPKTFQNPELSDETQRCEHSTESSWWVQYMLMVLFCVGVGAEESLFSCNILFNCFNVPIKDWG